MPDRILGIPCGCGTRKETLIDAGKPGKVELLIILLPILLIGGGLYLQRRG